MKQVQTYIFTAYFVLTMIVLGGTIFSVIVEYPNWFANVPQSLEATRNFYQVFHPGYFFQIFAPLSVLAALAAVIVNWKIPSVRSFVIIGLVLFVTAELLTFFYIYPRLGVMFGPTAAAQSVEVLRQAGNEFTNADRIRTGLTVLASASAIVALLKFMGRRDQLA